MCFDIINSTQIWRYPQHFCCCEYIIILCVDINNVYAALPDYIYIVFWLGKLQECLFLGPSFRKPTRKASSVEIYLKNKDLYATDR